MKRFATRLAPLLPPLMALLFFALLSRITYFRYENSDDIMLVKSFMGFEGGVRPTLLIYQHGLLVATLNALGRLAPKLPWFSLFQLMLLLLSLWALCFSMLRCARATRMPLWLSALLTLIFLGVFAAFPCARINFTTTAALAAAGSVALLISAGVSRARPMPFVLCSGALLALSAMLRTNSLPASICFWGVALCYLAASCARETANDSASRAERRLRRRSLLQSTAIVAAVGLALVGARLWEVRQNEAFFDFHASNGVLLDYHAEALESLPPETIAKLGWYDGEADLVNQWYFMDSNITADSFRVILEDCVEPPSFSARLQACLRTLGGFFAANPAYGVAAALLALLCALVLLRRRDCLAVIAGILSVVLFAAMTCYLAWQGRFLSRAVDCALFPAAAALSCLAISAYRDIPSRGRRIAALCLCALALVGSGLHLRATAHTFALRPDQVSPTREADLEAFALQHPDRLILRTPDLLRDTRLMPDVSSGIPTNLMIWGDWLCRTPSWNAQLTRFGYDPFHFTPEDFLRNGLLFATADEAPPEALMRYLRDGIGREVSATLYGTRGELRFFQFE